MRNASVGPGGMTVGLLLAIISAVIFAEVAVGVGVAFGRYQRGNGVVQLLGPDGRAGSATGAWAGWRDFRVTDAAFEDRSATQRSLILTPVDGQPLSDFAPGQFLTFSIDFAASPAAAARTIVRCYSMSDQPNASTYRVTVKRMPAPPDRPDLPAGAASTFMHDVIGVGSVLKVKAPAGQFVLDSTSNMPVVFLAGGVGVTPMISMIAWSLAHQPERQVRLFYGVRNSGDHAFKALLEQLARSHPNFLLHVLYAAPGPDDVNGRDFQLAGFIDVALLKRVLPHGRHLFYVCGPPPMMAALLPALAEWGVPQGDIHFESFGPASPGYVRPTIGTTTAPPAQSFDVQFRRSRRSIAFTGEDANLLDFAERHGIAVESGCCVGSCGSCETRLVSGAVRYSSTPDFVVPAGACLPCVCVPTSALVLEA